MNFIKNNRANRARAYPVGDAQTQHPATARNGQGLLHQGRVQRKKRVREIRLASWNVGTLTGRGRELADVLQRRRINVACLQETKWKGTKAREIGVGFKLFYCGSDGKRNGVGVVLDSEMKECVTNVKRVNDRLIVVKLLLGNKALNIVSVYAPQTGCSDVMKEKFWEDFDAVMIDIPSSEEVYIGGDFNGHVGRMNVGYERVHGGWGIGRRNKEGETLLQSATAFDLAIANTFFQKKQQHLVTYNSGNHSTQIDYFLLKRSNIKQLKDCKVVPGEALVSQHRLLVMDLKIETQISNRKARPPPKIKWYMLEKNECAKEFKGRVVDRMIEMKDMELMDVNECWNEMAECIRNVAREVCGETKGKGKIDKDTWWWNDGVQKLLKEKKDAFKNWKSVDSEHVELKEEKRISYVECKKRAKRAVAAAKGKVQSELYQALETPEAQKELFRLTKARVKNSRDIVNMKCMKDEKGQVVVNDEEIKKRWKEYFERLMNEENDWSRVLKNSPKNIALVRQVDECEVRKAVQGMKNGKALGPDGIPVEVWKCLKADGWKWLTLFFNKLLQSEAIPHEWCNSWLVPIYKNKGDVQECNNYRGIKLMSHSLKIWEKIIERRLREESDVTQNQFGFMPGRGTTDAIFSLRQLCEKYRRSRENLHMVFIDLEKAYDRVPREVLWWALKEKRVPGKYLHVIHSMYSQACTQVRSEAGITDQFSVAVGLHQGSALSPYLFLLVIDALTAEIQGDAPWCMLFADDIVLVGENAAELQSRLEKWQEKLESVGLKISQVKTEHLFCDFGGTSKFFHIALNGVVLPVCSDFRYLGSLIQNDGGIDRDVRNRINASWMKWRQVSGVTCDPQMPLKLKGRVYKTMVRPVMMYGSECWATKETDEKRMHVTEMRMLRWMCGVTRMDKIRNEYIRGSLKVAPVTEKIRSNRLAWYGHVMRRDENHISRRMLSMNSEGRCKSRGRPKKVWMDCVKSDMCVKEVTTEMTADRIEWKKKTYCADPA